MTRRVFVLKLCIALFTLLTPALTPLAPATVFAAPSAKTEVSGSLKSLYTSAADSTGKSYWSDLTRLRIELDRPVTDKAAVKIIYDNEALVGSILDTGAFGFSKDAREGAYFDLSQELIDRGDLYWRHRLYRAYGEWVDGETALTVGRQRVAWGQGRVWNPTDLFNPVSPLAIEPGERLGIDGVSMEYSFGPLSGVHVVYGPGRTSAGETAGARFRHNAAGYDVSVVFGEFRDKDVWGFDFAGSVGESGVRGEYTYTDPGGAGGAKEYERVVVGIDHSFPSTLYVLVEYLYNEGAVGPFAPLASLTNFTGEIVTRNRRFVALSVGYDFHPLVRNTVTAIYDKDGDGYFVSPSISYNIREDVDIAAGGQLFKDSGEYAGMEDLWYASLQWYF